MKNLEIYCTFLAWTHENISEKLHKSSQAFFERENEIVLSKTDRNFILNKNT